MQSPRVVLCSVANNKGRLAKNVTKVVIYLIVLAVAVWDRTFAAFDCHFSSVEFNAMAEGLYRIGGKSGNGRRALLSRYCPRVYFQVKWTSTVSSTQRYT